MSANIDYGDYGSLIHPQIKNDLRTRRNYLGNNNAYPVPSDHPVNGNFEQTCAKKRFNDLVEKYRQAAKITNQTAYDGIATIQRSVMMQSMMSVMESCEIENPHWVELAQLAVNIIREDFNIKEDEIIFNVKIVGFGNVEFPDNMKKDKEYFDPPMTVNYDVEDEVQKRRFINALISGASKKGHYIFHLGKTRLDEINPVLIPLYQLLMASNDLVYYMVPDEMAGKASESNELKAGYEKITFDADGKPIITVEAVNFPTLLHEIIKAVLELLATLALPDEKAVQEYIYDEADFILAEMWYLRLGPIFWEKLMNCFPTEYLDIKSQLLGKIFALPTNDFNIFMHSALSDDNNNIAKRQLLNMAKKIKEDIRKYNQDNS